MSTEPRLSSILRASAKELEIGFDKTSNLANMGDRGTGRELQVLRFLQPRLPGTVRAEGSSEIIDAAGGESGQCDIVIVDPTTPPFYSDDATRVYPIEAVHGVVEVKSTLTKAELRGACDKIASVKQLVKENYLPDPFHRTHEWLGKRLSYRPTFGMIFGYTADAELTTVAGNVIDWCEENSPEYWPDAIFVLDRGSIVWFVPSLGIEPAVRPGGQVIALRSTGRGDVLLTLALQVHTLFVTAWSPPLLLGAYLGPSALGIRIDPNPPGPAWPKPSTHEEAGEA